MQVLELIVNRLSAFEGDQFFTESDTIEQVDDLGSGCYGLHLRSKYQAISPHSTLTTSSRAWSTT